MNCNTCNAELKENQLFCTQCGNKLISNREISSHQNKKLLLLKRIGIIVVLLIGITYYFHTLTRNYHPVILEQPAIGTAAVSTMGKIESKNINAELDDENIVIPIEIVVKNRIVRFYDPSGEHKIPFIAYVTPRGKIVTAMSISESCRSNDFYLNGEFIHCANCQSYWNMESLEAYACCQKYYPDPIPSTLVKDKLVIKRDVIKNWRART